MNVRQLEVILDSKSLSPGVLPTELKHYNFHMGQPLVAMFLLPLIQSSSTRRFACAMLKAFNGGTHASATESGAIH
jgi:hypothetical protein